MPPGAIETVEGATDGATSPRDGWYPECEAVSDAPVVSVVLIFYEDERFLPEAIESVLAQSYTDWELILADDGSQDGSTAIARRYADAHPSRIRYTEHPGHANRGASATRNLGIRHARGRYVALMDSDDVWCPEKLAEQVALLDEHPEVGLLFGASLYWWSWAEHPARPDRLMPIGTEPDRVVHPPELVTELYPLGHGTAPCPSSCIVRREVFATVGGFEEHMPWLYEDQGFLTKAYLSVPVYVSSRCWDRYRRHPGGVTMSTSPQRYHEIRRYWLAWYEQHLREQRVTDAAVWAALRRGTWPYRYPRLAAVRRTAGRLRARLRRRVARRRATP